MSSVSSTGNRTGTTNNILYIPGEKLKIGSGWTVADWDGLVHPFPTEKVVYNNSGELYKVIIVANFTTQAIFCAISNSADQDPHAPHYREFGKETHTALIPSGGATHFIVHPYCTLLHVKQNQLNQTGTVAQEEMGAGIPLHTLENRYFNIARGENARGQEIVYSTQGADLKSYCIITNNTRYPAVIGFSVIPQFKDDSEASLNQELRSRDPDIATMITEETTLQPLEQYHVRLPPNQFYVRALSTVHDQHHASIGTVARVGQAPSMNNYVEKCAPALVPPHSAVGFFKTQDGKGIEAASIDISKVKFVIGRTENDGLANFGNQ